MNNMSIFYAILILVGVLVGIALIWFLVELIVTIKKSRKKMDELHKQITPTLENIEAISTKIQPAVEKIDPLIERVSLTIDAANLELMRADQIVENFSSISESALNATNAVGSIASAPADLLTKAGQKISGMFTGNRNFSNLLGGGSADPNMQKIVNQSNRQGKRINRKVRKAPRHMNNNPQQNNVVQTQNLKQQFNNNQQTENPYVAFNK